VIYQATIKTLAGLADFTYLQSTLKVTKGLVYKVEIAFPPGCANLLKVRIFDGGHQTWPSNLDESFHTDGFVISFDDTLLKLAAPFQYTIHTVNEDTIYDHSVTIRIGMVSEEMYIARFLPSMAYQQMLEVLRAETERQEAQVELEREAILDKPFSWIEENESANDLS